jgi:hypothetical protein
MADEAEDERQDANPDRNGADTRTQAPPGWPAFPDGVRAHDSVDLDQPDPARPEDTVYRRCVAATTAGGRCGAPAIQGRLICSVHDGRASPAAGGHAKARLAAERKQAAEQQAALAQLGTRAVVAAALAEKHDEIRRALHVLATAAASGDVKSAQALIPWLNQGLGMPTERIQQSTTLDAADLASLSTDELQELVALKRRERMRAESTPQAEPGQAQTG